MPEAKCAFILENVDRRLLGLVFDKDNNLYALERDGYRAVPLGIAIDPGKQRMAVMANIFNIVVRSRDNDGADWWAVDADTYSPLGHYRYDYPESAASRAAEWIFPFRLTFTDVDDSYACPRITNVSFKALALGSILAAIMLVWGVRRRRDASQCAAIAVCTLVFGIYFFIIKLLKV